MFISDSILALLKPRAVGRKFGGYAHFSNSSPNCIPDRFRFYRYDEITISLDLGNVFFRRVERSGKNAIKWGIKGGIHK